MFLEALVREAGRSGRWPTCPSRSRPGHQPDRPPRPGRPHRAALCGGARHGGRRGRADRAARRPRRRASPRRSAATAVRLPACARARPAALPARLDARRRLRGPAVQASHGSCTTRWGRPLERASRTPESAVRAAVAALLPRRPASTRPGPTRCSPANGAGQVRATARRSSSSPGPRSRRPAPTRPPADVARVLREARATRSGWSACRRRRPRPTPLARTEPSRRPGGASPASSRRRRGSTSDGASTPCALRRISRGLHDLGRTWPARPRTWPARSSRDAMRTAGSARGGSTRPCTGRSVAAQVRRGVGRQGHPGRGLRGAQPHLRRLRA